MKSIWRRLLLGGLLVFGPLVAPTGDACTTFQLPKSAGKIVGKSFDWHQDHGLAFINRKNQEKVAFTLDPKLVPAKWTSKYGSLTLNQYGREMPIGGMNEAGLVIETMWLEESVYPPIGSQPTVNEVQFVQYQLDNFANVTEVLTYVDQLRVALVYGKLHYMVCEAAGDCAIIEYINGEVMTERLCNTCGEPIFVLTNDTYLKSLDFLRKFLGFGGSQAAPTGQGSLPRFVRASIGMKAHDPVTAKSDVAYAFETLDKVRQNTSTVSVWNNVYDRANMRVFFRTVAHPAIKSIDLKGMDYSCRKPAKMLEMNASGEGDVTAKFVDYDRAANRKLIDKSFSHIVSLLPPGTLDRIERYPETLRCTE